MRISSLLVGAIILLFGTSPVTAATPEINPSVGRSSVLMRGQLPSQAEAISARDYFYQNSAFKVVVDRYYAPVCDEGTLRGFTSYCANVTRAAARNCPLGLDVARTLDPVTDEELARAGRGLPTDCTPRDAPVQVTSEMVLREFQVLPLAGSGIMFQPQDGRPVINLPFIVQSSAAPQLLRTTILGTSVLIEATPSQFVWDYGDGSEPYVTTDPNKRYPDHAYEHTYTKRGPVTVSLSTTWRGRFQVAGGAWQTIPGRVTTNESSNAITVIELLPVNIN